MENYAKKLALDYKIMSKSNSKTYPIKKMLTDFEYIGKTYDILNESIANGVSIPPSGEWILDNYYLIEEQANSLKKELSISKYKKLPSINNESRIYVLAKELVKFTDAYITEENIETFIRAYQTKKSISMEELWLLPTMIKISLIEHIKELCEKIMSSQLQKFKVESLVERIIHNKKLGEQRFRKYKNIFLEAETGSYVEYLIYCLKRFGKDGLKYIQVLEEEIQKIGTTSSDIIRVEHYDLALRRVSMSNSITSIRNISRLNFVVLFEKINPVDSILNKDEWYYKLDFETRNTYRNEIKLLAKKSKTSEVYVSMKLIEISKSEHIGRYLLGDKRDDFEITLGIKSKRKKCSINTRTIWYIVAIYLPTIVVSFLLTGNNFVLAVIPISELFIVLINRILNKLVKPKLLPRLEEVSSEINTFVVIPTIITSKERVIGLMRDLERYYLGNKMDNLYFALLGDVSESDTEKMPFDEEVSISGKEEAEKLNNKYGKNIFFFLYRKRIFNKSQGKFLGYERKRGLLLEFNRLLLNGTPGSFITNTLTDEIIKKKFKYVITLDADTELIIDSAKKLIGIMEHPLNTPVIKNGVVVNGYGIIQPKVGISLESSNKSIFTKIYGGSGGLDIYSTAESNIYQDVFGEAIFTGKGIYNVEVFESVLENQIPENTVLSHDLLEGSYIRCGLASDVEVIDGFPSKVNSYMTRDQRWTRGDWQIIKWITKGPINLLSRYKILDNLRRSLYDVSLLVLFFCGYFLLPIFIIFFPFIFDCISTIFLKLKKVFAKSDNDVMIKNKNYLPRIIGLKASLYKCVLDLIFLPYKSILHIEAIIVTLYRIIISKKHLLDWVTAADAEKLLGNDLKSFVKEMIISPLVGLILVGSSLVYNQIPLEASFSLFLIWLTMPFVSFIISQNDDAKQTVSHSKKTEKNKKELIEIASRTWNYFNDLTNSDNNYLPPDNYQCKRKEAVAFRTSSTNIGLGLLAIISAKDLGFIDEDEMIDKLSKSLDTINKLEKWNGHLYNWYNTKTKKVLEPAFVSTVDSGNFIGYLFVVLQSLIEMKQNDKTEKLIILIERIIRETDFSVLYDIRKCLFSVGFDRRENKLVDSYYDLLASEARLASFVAIAKRDIPYKHWFSLGRTLTTLDGRKGLVSWGGTMFEYFMPYIVMKNYKYTLMDETYEFCIYSQKKYANKLNIPWGISESAFYLQDLNYNYQYKTFGIPWLGVKRGLKEEVVVSPYSSIMTLDKNEDDVIDNINRLKDIGAYGKYGFYDAIDYTPGRVGNKKSVVVKTYMAHHQALILLSINNFINNNILKERFSKNQEIKTLEILLQEKVPQDIIFTKKKKEKIEPLKYVDYQDYSERVIYNPNKFVNVLSNDTYTLILNDYGEGYSVCDGRMISRYNENQKNSNFVIIKDINNNQSWSNTKAPLPKNPDKYQVDFSPATIAFYRTDTNIETVTKIAISAEDNIELRSMSILNGRKEIANIDVVSYFESPLCRQEEDIAHMAFQNMFLEIEQYKDACILKRRSRLKCDDNKYCIHFAFADEKNKLKFELETDKSKIVGVGNDISNADIVYKDKVYSNDARTVLNTAISYKTNVYLNPGEKTTIHYLYCYANTKEECINIYEKYCNSEMLSRVYDLALSRSMIENRFLGYKASDISLYNDVISQVMEGSTTRKKYESNIIRNRLRQKDLWKFGISGDIPIIMIRIKNVNETDALKQLIRFVEYANHKKISIDLVIMNEENNSYEQFVMDKIFEIINSQNENYLLNIMGGIHIVKKSQITSEEVDLLMACSDIIFDAHDGLLEEQLYETK